MINQLKKKTDKIKTLFYLEDKEKKTRKRLPLTNINEVEKYIKFGCKFYMVFKLSKFWLGQEESMDSMGDDEKTITYRPCAYTIQCVQINITQLAGSGGSIDKLLKEKYFTKNSDMKLIEDDDDENSDDENKKRDKKVSKNKKSNENNGETKKNEKKINKDDDEEDSSGSDNSEVSEDSDNDNTDSDDDSDN